MPARVVRFQAVKWVFFAGEAEVAADQEAPALLEHFQLEVPVLPKEAAPHLRPKVAPESADQPLRTVEAAGQIRSPWLCQLPPSSLVLQHGRQRSLLQLLAESRLQIGTSHQQPAVQPRRCLIPSPRRHQTATSHLLHCERPRGCLNRYLHLTERTRRQQPERRQGSQARRPHRLAVVLGGEEH